MTATAERLARCACGQLQVRCAGEPVRISVCHCLACKARTGGAFSTNATYSAQQVRPLGEDRTFARDTDAGRVNRFHFCPQCGATVFYDIDARPGMVSIPVGAFMDPAFPAPTVEVYPERRVDWCTLSSVVVDDSR